MTLSNLSLAKLAVHFGKQWVQTFANIIIFFLFQLFFWHIRRMSHSHLILLEDFSILSFSCTRTLLYYTCVHADPKGVIPAGGSFACLNKLLPFCSKGIRIGNATIVKPNLPAANGIIHIIDQVQVNHNLMCINLNYCIKTVFLLIYLILFHRFWSHPSLTFPLSQCLWWPS